MFTWEIMYSDFNPRSREGSDYCCKHPKVAQMNFNPRSREGSDSFQLFVKVMFSISIHAPAKGATWTSGRFYTESAISIHAPAKGATWTSYAVCAMMGFQSTLPRRERRSTVRPSDQDNDFNPRSREGSDAASRF